MLHTRQEEQEEAKKLLEESQFPEATLEETEIIQAQYFHENDQLFGLEKTMLDITKGNFAVFGAIMLLSNAPYYFSENNVRSKIAAAVVATVTIMIVSVAASFLVTLYHKYLWVHRQKVSILQRGVWQRRPLKWLRLKYTAEGLKGHFEGSASLGFVEYLTYGYILQWINIIPFAVALLIGPVLYALASTAPAAP